MGFTFLITFHMEVCNIRLSLLHVTSVFICITFISCGYFFETKMVELNIHKHLLDNIRSKKEFKFYRTDLLEPSWNFTLTLDSGNTNLPLTPHMKIPYIGVKYVACDTQTRPWDNDSVVGVCYVCGRFCLSLVPSW